MVSSTMSSISHPSVSLAFHMGIVYDTHFMGLDVIEHERLSFTIRPSGFPGELTISTRLGVLSIILGFALGIANLFHASLLILFSIILLYVFEKLMQIFHKLTPSASVSSLVLVFVEIPLLLRICPTSSKFDAFIRRFTTNYMRAAIYGILSVVQWLSLLVDPSSLIASAVVLAAAGACYALAGFKQQDFVGSKTLGGQGVAQMIV